TGVRAATDRAATVMARAVTRMLVQETNDDRYQSDADAAAFPSPAQDLPLLRSQCAEDRLQGRAPAAALYFRARQDRSLAHQCGAREEAARAGGGDEAGPFPGRPALRRAVSLFPAFPGGGHCRARRPTQSPQVGWQTTA